tara:strand:- start:214 stop:786 length:573 start_codon:yes stop_codon:yes gene_type:complete
MKVVYKLFCKDSNIEKFYIGSSENFKKRLSIHKSRCKSSNYNFNVYKYIREHGGWSNWTYLFLEEYENGFDKNLLKERELYYIDLTWDMNLNVERPYSVGDGRVERQKNYKKIYRQEHKNEINEKAKICYKKYRVKRLEKNKINYQQNRVKILERQKIKINCGFCGLNVTKHHISRHQKTKKCKLIQENL